jgi:hypothetical protein
MLTRSKNIFLMVYLPIVTIINKISQNLCYHREAEVIQVINKKSLQLTQNSNLSKVMHLLIVLLYLKLLPYTETIQQAVF